MEAVRNRNAIVVVNNINMLFKVDETVRKGDRTIKVAGTHNFRAGTTLYSIVNPTTKEEEEFFITEINAQNNQITVRMARNGRPVPEAQDAGFVNEYIVRGLPNDPYIFEMSVGGFTTPEANSPVVVSNSNHLHITIPHEMLHKDPHFLNDVGVHESNIMNCMYREGTILHSPLRLFGIQPVQTNCGPPAGNRENQWLKINRQNENENENEESNPNN
jgi:hypothetical protein